jgi:hypothetical protein
MNFDSYRRAMDENKLSDEKKALLAGYAEATPLHGSPKFEKLKRRKKAKIASLASLAACFTLVCLAGTPLLFFGLFWRAGSTAPEESLTTSTNAIPPWYLMDEADSDKHNTFTEATMAQGDPDKHNTFTGATAATNGANSGSAGYNDIYLLMQSNQSMTDDSQSSAGRTEGKTEDELQTEPSTSPLPVIVAQSYSAKATDSTVTVTNSKGEEKTLVYGESTRIIALYSYKDLLIVCADIENETVAFVYTLTEAGVPTLLGDLSVSGRMTDVSFDGNILTVITEFTPSVGDITDYAAYIPQYTSNGKTLLVPAENCIVTGGQSGEYTCFVVIEIELSDTPSILSVRAEFTQKGSAHANKK